MDNISDIIVTVTDFYICTISDNRRRTRNAFPNVPRLKPSCLWSVYNELSIQRNGE